MPKHSHFLLYLLVAATGCYASAEAAEPAMQPATPWMTGQRLLTLLEPVSPDAVSWSSDSKFTKDELAVHYTTANVEYVRGYIAALHDATEWKSWCPNPQYKVPKPDTFWDESRWGLASLSPAQLQHNAADLLVDIWRRKWPCPSSYKRR